MTCFDDDSKASGIPVEILETKEMHSYYDSLIEQYHLQSSDFNQYQILKDNPIEEKILQTLQEYMRIKENKQSNF